MELEKLKAQLMELKGMRAHAFKDHEPRFDLTEMYLQSLHNANLEEILLKIIETAESLSDEFLIVEALKELEE